MSGSDAGRAPRDERTAPRRLAHSAREGIRRHPRADRAYRTTVGVTGGGLVALGVALIPLPGPGSLIALGGLAVLGTEFEGPRKASVAANRVAKKAAAAARERRARRRAAREADERIVPGSAR